MVETTKPAGDHSEVDYGPIDKPSTATPAQLTRSQALFHRLRRITTEAEVAPKNPNLAAKINPQTPRHRTALKNLVRQGSDDENRPVSKGIQPARDADEGNYTLAQDLAAMSRVVALHVHPEFYGLSIRDRATRAGVTIRAFQEITRGKPFRDALQDTIFAAAFPGMARAMSAMIESAAIVGHRGAPDRKLLFTITGLIGKGLRYGQEGKDEGNKPGALFGGDLAARAARVRKALQASDEPVDATFEEAPGEHQAEPEEGQDEDEGGGDQGFA